ncbi:response regulator transcription factor [Burkholderia cenocepacia]|uniref:response regulator transcription factor n=1 Tax=Burkholderia cepacia complex TaxID=87882 RepID=UPI000D00CC50|nr:MULTISPECIES: response regulator transcription factor [Burkholderia cepacia complex]MBR8383918.1 response regulator transcription factor [Burkholderia cenocepacia]MBR8434917.1 response regulator transcription factor [Burkholderia cenocepacia]PRG95814.1 DNA-binding response regulator [Burkholderia multivorans]
MIVAILEDVEQQAKTLASWLRVSGYETIIRPDGDSFIELLRTQKVDVLLLDWDVPGPNGIEVTRWVRQTFADAMPIIIVTQHDSEEDVVFGLNSGADDFLTKPVRQRELMARVGAQVRRYYPETQDQGALTLGKYKLDPASRRVHVTEVSGVEGDSVLLSAREFELAMLLFGNAGRIVSKDFLLTKVWGAVDRKYDASLATYVSKLRNALALRSKNGLVISTVYNYGYRLERT